MEDYIKEEKVMKIDVKKIAKVVVPVGSAVFALASSYLGQKELDEKVSQKVAEALQKASENQD